MMLCKLKVCQIKDVEKLWKGKKQEQVFPEVVDVEDWRRGFSLAAGHPTSFLAWVDAVIVGAS